MSLNEEVELLRNIPMFAKIEPSKLKLLAFTSERLTFKAGETQYTGKVAGNRISGVAMGVSAQNWTATR